MAALPWIQLVSGLLLNVDTGVIVKQSGSNVLVTPPGQQPISIPGGTLANSSTIIAALQAAAAPIVISSTLVWTSITPNTANHTLNYAGALVGVGFLASGISTTIKADDGSGHTAYFNLVVASDTSASFPDTQSNRFPAAGTYTLYYSFDGANWITTGLTVTVS